MLLQITSAYNAISASGAQLKSLPQYVAKTQGRRKVEGGGGNVVGKICSP